MIEFPQIEDDGTFNNIILYAAPPGIKEYVYSNEHTPKFHESKGWNKVTISCIPDRIHTLTNAMRGKGRQYGLKHRVTATIHGCQGDTIHKLATQICSPGNASNLWDKAQVVVLLSCTRVFLLNYK